ncbi:MAG: hypothetical protein QOD52_2132 [Gaiellaceae bacterium]|nr:hypothetical protein [Gaiellaceae bacterium]
MRSGARTARIAERSLLASLRPLLAPSRIEDAAVKVGFMDDKWFRVPGGGAVAETADDALYLAIAVRNVGSGIAVLHGWYVHTEPLTADVPHPAVDGFRRLTRDLYIAPGEVSFWQGAFREPEDPVFAATREAIDEPRRIGVDVLYGDHELGQRSITRFALTPRDDGRWLATVARHWNVDRPDPR